MNNHSNISNTLNNSTTSTSPQDLGLHFLEMARLGLPRGLCDMDEDEESPTELNTINSSGGFLLVTTDKLSVKYTNVNLHGHDVGVVQANKPAPVKRLVYYFEIHVKDAGAKGQIAIGFTTESFKMRRQPGWEPNSCGYHGDDGLLYRGLGKKEPFGPTYTSGDTVGAGINYASQEFFFTKNGIVVGAVEKDMKGPLFPTIAVHSQNEEVLVNFGQKPFAFDLKVFETQERMKQQAAIEKLSLPSNVSYRIVRSYLQHYGYEDTLSAFDMACQSTVPPIYIAQENGFDEQDIVYALNQRKTLRQLIRKGEIDAALGKLSEWYPQIVQTSRCSKFNHIGFNWISSTANHMGSCSFGNLNCASVMQRKLPSHCLPPHLCPLCLEDHEDLQRLFFECGYAKNFWLGLLLRRDLNYYGATQLKPC